MGILEKTVGISGISDYNNISTDKDKMYITTGSNLGEILNIAGVCEIETISNNILDVEKVFGIDAARKILYQEILSKTRNTEVARFISDFMTCKGYVIFFKKDNPLLLERGFLSSMSFENPKQDIKRVLQSGAKDNVSFVYSQIIAGMAPNIGSGSNLFTLIEDDDMELDWSME